MLEVRNTKVNNTTMSVDRVQQALNEHKQKLEQRLQDEKIELMTTLLKNLQDHARPHYIRTLTNFVNFMHHLKYFFTES